MAPPEAIPFVDLKAQYAALRESIDARIRRVLDHGQYVMGPEVRELEERLPGWGRGPPGRGGACRSGGTRGRAPARPTRAERAAPSPRSAAPASIPPSRSAATATAGR